MAATAAQVAQLRRMIAEPTTATYTDDDLEGTIEAYPLVDENGEAPRIPSTTLPGEMEDNEDWTATYDLHAAAAAIWEEKAAGQSAKYDFSADGGSYQRSQMMQQCLQMARYYASRRSPKTIILVPNVIRELDEELTN